MCGLGRIPDNSLMVACGDEVVVVAVHNAPATGDVAAAIGIAAADDVVVVVGVVAAVDGWVQQCLMTACTNL